MKYSILSLWHVLFFLLLFVVSHIIEAEENILRVIKLILLVVISIVQIKFLAKKAVLNHILYSIISLLIIFELFKFMEFSLGFLPKYGEVPFIWSILLSLVVFSMYVMGLYLVQRLFLKMSRYFLQ